MAFRKIFLGILLLTMILVAGCGRPPVSPAGLVPLPEAALADWGLPAQISEQGTGNLYRVVEPEGSNGSRFLELATGGDGRLEYYCDTIASPGAVAHFRLQFLSTQGIGRVKLSGLDSQGRVVATVGWIATGPLPPAAPAVQWNDRHYDANYLGNWWEETYNFQAALAGLSAVVAGNPNDIATYRLSIEVGNGQHALISQSNCSVDYTSLVHVQPVSGNYTARLGETVSVAAEVENTGWQPLPALTVKFIEPEGFGLAAVEPEQTVAEMAPGEKRRLVWEVKVQRPDGVNSGRPWPVNFAVNGIITGGGTQISAADPRPGKIYYVMTEDLEPIDSAGYPAPWGNADGWLEPEELQTQMVGKSEALNNIADRYGAKWTHYIAWPVVKAAEWAADRSAGGEWRRTVETIKQSVRQQARQGHEYALHMHSDYDPMLAGNFLSYNPARDGLWANHLRHGWAHSLTTEGNFDDYDSRTGTLYAYQRILDELSAASEQGQLLTARAGSFDFGNGPADEAMSSRAYHKVGLWGSSDADGNAGGLTAGSYGQEIYLADESDINNPAATIADNGLVEIRPTPRDFIGYDSQSAEVLNRKAAQGLEYFLADGIPRAGVHAVIGFTHAMFVMGAGNWQSTTGGQFDQIDAHLAYLKQNYVDKGLLTFGTASQLVADYLDYYTPRPVAVYGPRLADGYFSSEYAIKILGRDIPADAGHIQRVSVKYPLYMRDSAYRISVLKNGRPIYTTWGLPTPYNDIIFTFDDRNAVYTLKIYHNQYVQGLTRLLSGIKTKFIKLSDKTG